MLFLDLYSMTFPPDYNTLKSYARSMRRQPTDAEHKLWGLLRVKRLDNNKFRRQFPIGPYIVDFCCFKKRLVIELDGGQHMDEIKDQIRSAYLNQLGFRVLRFWNNQVLYEIDSVYGMIQEALEE